MLRRIFRCLERPDAAGLNAQDEWCEPKGHSTTFRYQPFGGYWGSWHHVFVALDGPKEWVFKPFVDEQTMIGSKGRMIYKQHHLPQNAAIGSVWLCPHNSFKRVLSRGGAWENVNLGSTHPDEKDHDNEQSTQPETEQRNDSPEVSIGADQSAPGNGDNGETVSESSVGRGAEDISVKSDSVSQSTPETGPAESTVPVATEGEGFDGNGSPVV